jgi:hypothetical protein
MPSDSSMPQRKPSDDARPWTPEESKAHGAKLVGSLKQGLKAKGHK